MLCMRGEMYTPVEHLACKRLRVSRYVKRRVLPVLGKFAFGDQAIPIHARTQGSDEHEPKEMDVYYGTAQSAVVHTN